MAPRDNHRLRKRQEGRERFSPLVGLKQKNLSRIKTKQHQGAMACAALSNLDSARIGNERRL